MASSVNAQSQICCNSCICHPEWPASPPLLLFARPISPSHGSSDPNFSIVVVAIVGILATAFLLVSYYAIVAKCYRNLDTVARRLHGIHSFVNRQNPQTESWSLQDNGLEESVIQSIPVCKYTRQGGFIEGTECAVCLNEFQEDERLRLLPKCSHAFHLHCIDTWLQSHSNCPLCRANIMNPSLESVQFVHTESSSDSTTLQHVAEVIDEGQILRARNGLNALDNADEVAPNAPVDKNEAKENATAEIIAGPRSPLKKLNPPVSSLTHTRTVSDLASKVPRGYACIPPLKNQNLGEEMQPMRRSFSMDSSSHRLCISITDLLAMHPGLHDVNASDGSSSTKRSFFFFGNSRGRNAILPI